MTGKKQDHPFTKKIKKWNDLKLAIELVRAPQRIEALKEKIQHRIERNKTLKRVQHQKLWELEYELRGEKFQLRQTVKEIERRHNENESKKLNAWLQRLRTPNTTNITPFIQNS